MSIRQMHRFSREAPSLENYDLVLNDLDDMDSDSNVDEDDIIASVYGDGIPKKRKRSTDKQIADLLRHRNGNLTKKLKILKEQNESLVLQVEEAKSEKTKFEAEYRNVTNELDRVKDLKFSCISRLNEIMSDVSKKIYEVTNPIENQVRTAFGACQNAINGQLIPEIQKIEKIGIDKCKVCMDEEIEACLIPCGHTCCAGCAVKMDNCHMCRGVIADVQNVFL